MKNKRLKPECGLIKYCYLLLLLLTIMKSIKIFVDEDKIYK